MEGFPFCQGRPVTIPKSQFKSNILCRKHNNQLSPVDQVGGSVFDALAGITAGTLVTKRKCNGSLFERWLLKTLINFELIMTNFDAMPPLELVDRAFGKRPFLDGSGLFYMGREGLYIPSEEGHVTYMRLTYENQNDIRGGLFLCNAFAFALMFGAPDSSEGQVFQSMNILHHPRRFVRSDSKASVIFGWKTLN
jgi:hypothetical protein